MSVTAVPLHPLGKGTIAKLWIGILAALLLGAGLAWLGTSGQQYAITESGLRIRTLKEGTGKTITSQDLLALNMTGMIKGGETIHQTQPSQPDIFAPDQVIPGLREALLTMKKDGVYQVIIPPELAYGATPPPGAPIPPNATLEFRVQVLGVLEGMAAMQQMMGQQGQQGPGGGLEQMAPGGPGGPEQMGPPQGPAGPGQMGPPPGPGGPGGR
jgi:FKBP-type peptidyl-prolyl cis-trans isomerase FkpA